METQFQSNKVLDNQSFQQLQTTFCHHIPTKMNFKKKILIIRALYLHLPPKHIQWLSQISRPFHKLEISNISSQNTLIWNRITTRCLQEFSVAPGVSWNNNVSVVVSVDVESEAGGSVVVQQERGTILTGATPANKYFNILIAQTWQL